VAYDRANGKNTTFEDVTQHLVQINGAATCSPAPELRLAYNQARGLFLAKRKQVHGI
jgi:hypothetical protein